jgi:hypothetical protein
LGIRWRKCSRRQTAALRTSPWRRKILSEEVSLPQRLMSALSTPTHSVAG